MIGERIKKVRLEKGMTQASLGGDTVTRNQISQIENGVANPSVATVTELAARLEVPAAYLFSDKGELLDFCKIGAMDKIKKLYCGGEYKKCLTRLSELGGYDDETYLIAARCHLAIGIERYRAGTLTSAVASFSETIRCANASVYAEEGLAVLAEAYAMLIGSVKDDQPLCDNADKYYLAARSVEELWDVVYMMGLQSGKTDILRGSPYARHLEARAKMNGGEVREASRLLSELLSEIDESRFAVLKYYVLCDLEICSRQSEDYKKAYECSAARLLLRDKMNR